jgi:hypothetical protein
MHLVYVLAAESEFARELPFPAWVFGVIGIVVFFTLGFVTFTYRDVANRHRAKFNRGPAPEQGHGSGTGH